MSALEELFAGIRVSDNQWSRQRWSLDSIAGHLVNGKRVAGYIVLKRSRGHLHVVVAIQVEASKGVAWRRLLAGKVAKVQGARDLLCKKGRCYERKLDQRWTAEVLVIAGRGVP